MSHVLPTWALRALTKIDEARIAHLTAVIDEIKVGDESPLKAANDALDEAHTRYVQHSTELRQRFSPAASSLAKATPSGGAMHPDPSA